MRFVFGRYWIEPATRTLGRSATDAAADRSDKAERVAVEPKVFDLLAYLLARRERIVAKAELLGAVWPGVHVSDAALSRAVQKARRAVGDDGAAQAIIRTVRRKGFQFVAPVVVDEPTRAANGPAVPSPDFVGRARELDRLTHAVDLARDACASTWLLAGEPGIGKSRLLREFVRVSEAAGIRVRFGSCYEADPGPALWPWLRILREELGSDPGAAQALGRDAAADLARLMPELVPLLGPLDQERARRAEPLDAAQLRIRCFGEIVELFLRSARRGPLLIAIDDLQRADVPSLQLLELLGRELAGTGSVVVGTLREAEAHLEAERGEWITRWVRSSGATVLRLARLDRAEVSSWLEHSLGDEATPTIARWLHAQSGGNPLFLHKLASLVRAGRIRPGSAAEQRLPRGLREAVLRQLAGLPAECGELLEKAAVIGPEFEFGWLEAPAGALEPALERGLLEPLEGDRLRFSHTLVRDALYRRLDSSRRAQLHGEAARALERQLGIADGPQLAALAHHLERAGGEGDPGRAALFARRAADWAASHLAFEEALVHYGNAIRLLRGGGGIAPAEAFELLLAGARAAHAAGRKDVALAAAEEAAALARTLDDPVRLSLAADMAADCVHLALPNPVGTRLVEEARAAVGGDEPALARRLEARRMSLLESQGRSTATLEELWRGVEAARKLPEADALPILYQHFLTLEIREPAMRRERLSLANDLVIYAQRVGRLDLEVDVRRHRVGLLTELGRGPALDAEIASFARRAQETRIRSMRHHAAAFRAMRALLAGRYGEVERHLRDVQRLADPSDPAESRFTPTSLSVLMVLDRASEVPPALEHDVRELISDIPSVRAWRLALALLLMQPGRRAELARLFGELAGESLDRTVPPFQHVIELASLAEVSHALDDGSIAPGLRSRLLPHADTAIVHGWGVACQGPVSYYLALLSELLGERDEAERHFEAALAFCERLGAPPWRARTLRSLARMLERLGRGGDRERARAYADEAHAIRAELVSTSP